MTYCIDTSALMDGWTRHYMPVSFPSLWQRVDELIEAGSLLSSEEVLIEIEKKQGDKLHEWAKGHAAIFLPLTADVQQAQSRIVAQFPKLVDERTGKSFADPWVIATAEVRAAVVVTGEGATGKRDRPKIPDVCRDMGIECIRFAELIRREGWRF